jgi:addiction module HigA family antidote
VRPKFACDGCDRVVEAPAPLRRIERGLAGPGLLARVLLSKILNCRDGISAEMSLRLSAALGTSPSFWFDMQTNYDFARAKRKKLPKIMKLPTAA